MNVEHCIVHFGEFSTNEKLKSREKLGTCRKFEAGEAAEGKHHGALRWRS
jgi:hypothetical protein